MNLSGFFIFGKAFFLFVFVFYLGFFGFVCAHEAYDGVST